MLFLPSMIVLSRLKFFVVLLTLVLVFFEACKNNEAEINTQKAQITLSGPILELIRDTSKVNPLVDSLRKEIFKSNIDNQLILLGELAETWRPYSFPLAFELLKQSNQFNKLNNQSDAFSKFGIYYTRKYIFDSANYFFDKAEKIAREINSNALIAQVISWRAELLRLNGQNDSCIIYQDISIELAKKTNDVKRLAFCNISKGEANRFIGEFRKAIDCYEQAISYASSINDLNKITMCYNSLGDVYRTQNNYPEALNYFNKALLLAKQTGNKNQIAFCLSCMGDIFSAQGELEKALTYFNEAYGIANEIGGKQQQCNILSSMAVVYEQGKDFENALKYIDKSNQLAAEIGYIDKLAFGHSAKGQIYFSQNKFIEASIAIKECVNLAKKTGNTSLLASSYNQLAEVYIKLGKFNDAKTSSDQSIKLSYENGVINNIRESARLLANIYKEQGNYKSALEMAYLFIQMKDSVNNEENIKKIAATEYEAKEKGLKAEQRAKELTFKAEQEKKEVELNRQKTLRYAFTIGFVLVLLLVVVVFRSLQQNKKKNIIITAQKKEVESQKELVDLKNKEITDSITYAKRLQDAILPPFKMVQAQFRESFIFYKPKDIIAGDFYWMEKCDNTIFFAAADSTGHGVPGAMVSVVCSNALNSAVKEFKLTDPGKILDKTRELVLETFSKSEGEVKDGMDISLLCVNHIEKKILWSGANNPLLYFNSKGVNEIKAHKQPIGKTEYPTPFSTHQIDYSSEMSFYLITDGFADQFGGSKGKKFKYKHLKELLTFIQNKSMNEQLDHLETVFKEWKGMLDQIDDVTILGIKI